MIYHESGLYRTNIIFSNVYNILFKSIKYLYVTIHSLSKIAESLPHLVMRKYD